MTFKCTFVLLPRKNAFNNWLVSYLLADLKGASLIQSCTLLSMCDLAKKKKKLMGLTYKKSKPIKTTHPVVFRLSRNFRQI